MTPAAFIEALQSRMGDGFTVATHPKKRAEPQFDVFLHPKEFDGEGKPYRVTFSVRSGMLSDIDAEHAIIGEYAETIAANLTIQKVRGAAAPEWKN